MLLGHKIIAHADHMDLLNVTAASPDRVQRWRLYLEECGVRLCYAKGEENIVADALSRMQMHKVTRKELQQKEALKMMNQMTMTEKVNASATTNKSGANDALINCIFQNSKNNVRAKRTTAARRKNRRQPEQEVAPMPSLLTFPIK